jgi:hypothetical protein
MGCAACAHFRFALPKKRAEFVQFKTGLYEVGFQKLVDGCLSGGFFYIRVKTAVAGRESSLSRVSLSSDSLILLRLSIRGSLSFSAEP